MIKRINRKAKPWRERMREYLEKIQAELMPDHADEYLAINVETGEYTLGKTRTEAFLAFLERWPNTMQYNCRVDGGPSVKFRGI